MVEVPRGARVAYAKFMSKKIEQEYKKTEAEEPKETKKVAVKFVGKCQLSKKLIFLIEFLRRRGSRRAEYG